jgi:phage-related minor tail protein
VDELVDFTEEELHGIRAAHRAASQLESQASHRSQSFKSHEEDIDRKLEELFTCEEGGFAEMKSSLESFLNGDT